MGRIFAYIAGAVLFVLGVLALIGAVEVWRGGGDAEAMAQSFLVPASLFLVGGFAIWWGWQSGRD